ncbi:MAG: ion transporter [Rhodoferax sp.]|uniref:ion transporter n=1 Tax=Rhodoferax sp. TaxID=50421 RepID=UPI003BB61933
MKKLYEIMETSNSKLSKAIDAILLILISTNIILVILDSYGSFRTRYYAYITIFETLSVAVFTIEYIIRLICSPYRYSNDYKKINLVRYIISPMAIIDLLAIFPFYLPYVFTFDFRIFRFLRIFRLLRVLKITRYSKALDLIIRVFKKKKAELLLSTFILMVLIFFAGSLMFFAENGSQPQEFPNIVDSVKWAIQTMVFLGYDDVKPLSPIGNALGMIIVVLGLGWLTLPISVLSSGFIEQVKKDNNKCPHCGKEVD